MARGARLTPDKCVFLICDVQERFRSVIHNFPAVVAGSQRMLKASAELKIPAIVTEQYPKGLLKTVHELDVSQAEVFEKTCFTMLCPEVVARLADFDKVTDFVVDGIEAHVCVQQTSLDLLAQGFNVHLCVDALSSSTPVDRACGLHRAECACAARLMLAMPSLGSMPTCAAWQARGRLPHHDGKRAHGAYTRQGSPQLQGHLRQPQGNQGGGTAWIPLNGRACDQIYIIPLTLPRLFHM